MTFGGSNQSVTPTASSSLTVTLTSTTTGVCTVAGFVITAVGSGTCSITASQAGNTNYEAATQVVQTFASKATQTITFTDPADITYGQSPSSLSATSTSSLTVAFTTATSGICSVFGTTVTILTAGTCTINANQAGNANYEAASQVAQSFTIAKATQSITFATPSAMTVGVGGSTQSVSPTASSSLGVTLTSTTTGICTVAGFVITAVGAGTCSITARRAESANYEAAPDVIRTFDITVLINIAAIAGVTAPVSGAAPVSTTTAGTGYTGTVSWSGSPSTFAAGTIYTATITLTPTSGYTLTGVNANFFTVAGATSVSHDANSGVITAVFPAAGLGPAAKVAITRASVGTARRTAFTTQPQITIQDSVGNTVTSSSAVVTATVSAGGTLVGTTTATASSGVATFTGLGVDGTFGATYTITYTATGLTIGTATVTLSGTACDGSFTCQVGDTGPGGGKVFYVNNAGFTCGPTLNLTCKYLEAAPSNWNTGGDPSTVWAVIAYKRADISTIENDQSANNSLLGVGLGYKNSLAIVAQNGLYNASSNNYAAGAARGYAGGSQSDWYLPTTAELNLLCQWARGVAPSVTTRCAGGSKNSATYGAGSAGFVGDFYWSSSEDIVETAYFQSFNSGGQTSQEKDYHFYVRPVRSF
jgi:hypothetical protein